ncbi:hypothetical protein J6590_009112 [Homalodisca vitripennis]|nr:hypothetical protein J6590_009112 [Homalodisca vitripennis]
MVECYSFRYHDKEPETSKIPSFEKNNYSTDRTTINFLSSYIGSNEKFDEQWCREHGQRRGSICGKTVVVTCRARGRLTAANLFGWDNRSSNFRTEPQSIDSDGRSRWRARACRIKTHRLPFTGCGLPLITRVSIVAVPRFVLTSFLSTATITLSQSVVGKAVGKEEPSRRSAVSGREDSRERRTFAPHSSQWPRSQTVAGKLRSN